MHLKEAFLGGAQKNVIVTLVPEGWVPGREDDSESEEGIAGSGGTNARGASRVAGKAADPAVLREEFRALIPRWLGHKGPLTTEQLYELAEKERPELCDNKAACDCREQGDTVWQHQLRWAQQDLKESGKVELEGKHWRPA